MCDTANVTAKLEKLHQIQTFSYSLEIRKKANFHNILSTTWSTFMYCIKRIEKTIINDWLWAVWYTVYYHITTYELNRFSSYISLKGSIIQCIQIAVNIFELIPKPHWRLSSIQRELYLVIHILVSELFTCIERKFCKACSSVPLPLRQGSAGTISFVPVWCVWNTWPCPRVPPGSEHGHHLSAGSTQSRLGMTNWSEPPTGTCQERPSTPNGQSNLSLCKLNTQVLFHLAHALLL